MNLEERFESIKGTAGIYYKNLKTGEVIKYNENKVFCPASIIKLPIIMAIYKMDYEGKLSLDEKEKISYGVRVPSCGAFNAFTDEPVVDLRTLCFLMIAISDNTATNVLITHVGIERLNEEFRNMGLKDTKVERILFDSNPEHADLFNKITPAEIGMLLEKIWKGTFVNRELSAELHRILLEQQSRWKIPAYIEDRCQVANKTGETDDITGDAAIVGGDNPFVLVCIFNDTYVPEADEWIRHFAKFLYEKRELTKLSSDDFILEPRYAASENFTGQAIYRSSACWLNYETYCRLKKAAEVFAEDGYRIKIWDAYRPVSAQWKFWELIHDDDFVANPEHISADPPYRPTHMNGLCVDITLTDMDGTELEMPSEFDDMTERARADSESASETARKNAMYMKGVMEEAGFKAYRNEWWHFYDVTTEPVACFEFPI